MVNGYIDYMTQEEKMPLAEVLENMRSVGDDYYDFSTLDPETDYVAYAIGLGDSGTCTTLPTVKQFRTADLDPGQAEGLHLPRERVGYFGDAGDYRRRAVRQDRALLFRRDRSGIGLQRPTALPRRSKS